jgi:hypothetical protein
VAENCFAFPLAGALRLPGEEEFFFAFAGGLFSLQTFFMGLRPGLSL